MPEWIRIWIIFFIVAMASPLDAQEWIYCPAAPDKLEQQCRQTEKIIRVNQDRVDKVGAQMTNPNVMVVKVHRKPGESVLLYQKRVQQQQGVAAPATNQWFPVLGRYYDPDRHIMYVALDRQAYWQYVWETLAPDEELARRTFDRHDRLSRQFKQDRYTGPGGRLDQWQQAIDNAQRFRRQCCQALPTTGATGASIANDADR